MESVIWLFTLYCTADCIYYQKKVTNEYFSASSYDGCVQKANSLINLIGLTGTWQIECKPYKRKIITLPAQGN